VKASRKSLAAIRASSSALAWAFVGIISWSLYADNDNDGFHGRKSRGRPYAGDVLMMDTIRHDGKLWLVPEWLDRIDEGWRTPTRIVCMHGLQYQEITDDNEGADFLLNHEMPKAVLDGETNPGSSQRKCMRRHLLKDATANHPRSAFSSSISPASQASQT
jgi:hypothetical protein